MDNPCQRERSQQASGEDAPFQHGRQFHGRLTMNMPVGITLVAEFFVIVGISQLVRNLVNGFKSHCRLQKADRMVGLLTIWPSRSQFVCRAADFHRLGSGRAYKSLSCLHCGAQASLARISHSPIPNGRIKCFSKAYSKRSGAVKRDS